jgi:HAD superfamily hydrolase (TIGR01509 family)
MSRFDLVIFDCDGTLVDSEPASLAVLQQFVADLGLTMTHDEIVRAFVGRAAAASLALMARMLGRPLPDGSADEWERREFEAFGRNGVPAVGGVADAIDRITLPICVASSGSHARMAVTLGASGLLGRFRDRLDGRIFSATEVARGKPFPDLFLYAAQRMKAEPHRCAVIEDSPAGVTAAVAAGMTAFAYAAGAHSDPADLQQAGAVTFFTMADLPALVSSSRS